MRRRRRRRRRRCRRFLSFFDAGLSHKGPRSNLMCEGRLWLYLYPRLLRQAVQASGCAAARPSKIRPLKRHSADSYVASVSYSPKESQEPRLHKMCPSIPKSIEIEPLNVISRWIWECAGRGALSGRPLLWKSRLWLGGRHCCGYG